MLPLALRAGVAELADARDLKSREGNLVGVRFPPSAVKLWFQKVLVAVETN
jgi:hypothetical protein